MTSPHVSVVIPTYNRASCITRTIDSVFAQTYGDYEIIVVDDGSTDNTREVLGRYGNRIRYIHQPNSGVSSARNTGILSARGEWVAFLDSDDEWVRTKLERQIQIAIQYPSAVASVTNASIVISEQTELDLFKTRGFQFDSSHPSLIVRPLSLIIDLQPFTPSLFVLRQALLSEGLFDISMNLYEDYDMMCRIALAGAWAITGETLLKVFRRGEVEIALSVQHSRDPRKSPMSLIQVFLKLLNKPNLTGQERNLIRSKLSACRFELAACDYAQGYMQVGRKRLIQSFRDSPSVKSALRVTLLLCGRRKGLELLRRYHSRGHGSFRRSDFDQASLEAQKGNTRS
ncbi:MAG: glycosyl transferase family 2 [Deltaproteobacteria bacterium]|nr:glycosyl transferase family 2 [Deltaproteobacteria bacterium]